MNKVVSTNIQIPEGLWRSIKIRAAEEGRTMRDLILEGIRTVLGSKTHTKSKGLLTEFSGKVSIEVPDGSTEHDRFIYEKS